MLKPKIIQTFWVAPMKYGQIYHNLVMAYASAKSIKEQGYELVMYTDSVGEKLLAGFPYDDVKVVDMGDTNTEMFAAIKYFAMQQEPLGVVHLDFDIILNKPCIKIEDGHDIIIERKDILVSGGKYEAAHDFFEKNKELKEINSSVLSIDPFVVGAIGFNNEITRQRFLETYFDAVELFKNKKLNAIIDIVLEQQYLPYMAMTDNYSVYCVAPYGEKKILLPEKFIYYSDEISGYKHFHSQSKFSELAQNEFIKLIGNEDKIIINKNYMKYVR